MRPARLLAVLLCLAMALSLFAGCGSSTPANNSSNNAVPESNAANDVPANNSADTEPAAPAISEEEMAKLIDIAVSGAEAIAADRVNEGTYDIKVASGSDQFKIKESKLVSVAGVLQLVLNVEGDAYSKLFAGNASDAASAGATIAGEKNADGTTTFRIPVKSLNEVVKFAAYADEYGKWFDRTLLADASSLDPAAIKPVETADKDDKKDDPKKDDTPKKDDAPKKDDTPKDDSKPDDTPKEDTKPDDKQEPEDQGLADGDYTVSVTFGGGTGKAKILSPATLHVKGGKMTATVKWSSENYDYMKVNGQKILPSSTAGGSVFTIPVPALGTGFKVIGDTTAMSTPHEIEYTLRLDLQ